MDNIYFLFSRLLYSELSEVFKSLEIYKYAVVKGEPLSKFAYGDLNKRKSTDIDILINKNDIGMVSSILNENGFFQKKMLRSENIISNLFSHQLTPFVKKKTIANLTVDVNYDLFWGEYVGKRIDIDDFLSDRIEIEIYGMKVQTLPPIKTMIQLILHHYKEMNSIYHLAGHNCINHNMFKDVYYLWRNNLQRISLNNLYQMSIDYGIVPFVFYVLYFTNQIYGDPELEKYVAAFKTPEGTCLLDYYGLAEKERKLWKVNFRTRLETEDLFSIIKNDLTDADIEKLERNRRIFG